MKNILITGSSGTIGTRLSETLLQQKYNIIGVDKKPNKWNQQINKKTLILDLTRKENISKLPKNIDLIIHLAANAKVHDSVINPELAFENYQMLYNILEYARLNNIKEIIFSSSREIYGNTKTKCKEKGIKLENCESPYSSTKLAGESLIITYQKCYGINYNIVRLSNVYGMYDDSNRFIPTIMKNIKNKQNIIIYGKNKKYDFTYIDDTINGILCCIKHFKKNNIYNIASGKSISLLKLTTLFLKKTKSKNKIITKNNRIGEITNYKSNINKIKQIGYTPQTNIKKGIEKTIEWYNKW